MRSRTSNRSTPQQGKVRIIGGEWRGRKLPVAEVEGLRPTGDRNRETLFNWLQADILGANCLDLFAGTGALGLEALSRGAKHCDFVETNPLASQQLKDNVQLLSANAQVHTHKAADFLNTYTGPPYDIVFIDPPFADDLWTKTLEQLSTANCLNENTLIYIESPKATNFTTPTGWATLKSKQTGSISMELLTSNSS